MRGGVQLRVCAASLLLLVASVSGSFRCSDRTPEGRITAKTPVENKFQLKISGSPSTYEPGEKYTVSLQGIRQLQIPHKFTGFFLTVDSSESAFGSERGENQPRDVGTFHPMLGDALTQISETCPNAVTQTSSIYKSEVQVYWKAPPSGNGCVVFRATVVEDRYVWHMDDGALTLALCEDVHENINEQPEVLERCCACDEAKYEVTFEGLWSRHTHPKDFPSNGWLTRFSDIIGASHTSDYRFWQYGGIASEGLRQVAETGSTRMLESELKSESEHIRTIIKARGISYPNVTGKTFAVFRVDRKHHLMSLVSMIDPSPDWIVGVSGLELCLRNCSWVEFKVLNLFPWDAGTDSGTTYISPDSPTSPHDPIRQITSRFPKDDSSPFYDSSGLEMKPFARLYLTRQRLYEKSCADDSISPEEDDGQNECAVTEWSDWQPCSVSCGRGIRYRQRNYVDPRMTDNCNVKLSSKMTCYGKQKLCREGYYHYGLTNEDKESWDDDPMCQLTEWSHWSPCSSPCGQGVRTRSRKYKVHSARKKCSILPGAPELEQTDECLSQDDCDGEEHIEDDEMNENCQVTEWSEWSPCSVTCGSGTKMRTRLKITSEDAVMSGSEDYINAEGDDPCSGMKTTQIVSCEGEFPSCDILIERAKQICQLPQDPGPCRGYVERYYFDVSTESCQPFVYNGCRGNANNFFSREDCEATCSLLKEDLKKDRTAKLLEYGVQLSGVLAYHLPVSDEFGTIDPTCDPLQPTQSDQFSGLKPGNQIIDLNGTYGVPSTAFTPMTIESIYGDVIHCETSAWSRWSECSTSCGKGMKERTRHILVNPQNGGRPCPKKLLKRKRCKIQNCDTMVKQNSRESKETLPTWGGTNMSMHGAEEDRDCVLSQWSSWSPCSASCGLNAVMQRTRNVLVSPGLFGRPCGRRIETRPCNLLPCKF